MGALRNFVFSHSAVMRKALMGLKLLDIEIWATQHELELQQNWTHNCIQNYKAQKGFEHCGGEVVQGEV